MGVDRIGKAGSALEKLVNLSPYAYPLLYTLALLATPAAVADDRLPAGLAADAWQQVQAAIVDQVDAEIAAGGDQALRGGLAAVHGLIRRHVLFGDYADLPPQDAPDGPEFGYSVAMEGDVLVVGAPGTVWTHVSHGTAAHGAVFVFRRGTDSTWQLSQRLLRANGTSGSQPGSRCGHAVALRLPDMVFGCPEMRQFGGQERRGGYYTYRLVSSGFIDISNTFGPTDGGRCGAALALSPNYLAIGCPGDGGGPGQVRIAAKLDLAFNIGNPEAILTPGADVFGFGWALALREPGTFFIGEPGNVRLAIGAPNTVFAGTAFPRGSVFAYRRALGSPTWTVDATLRPAPLGSSSAGLARFGAALAMNRNHLLVGAPNNRWSSVQSLPGPGTAHRYLLANTAGGWVWQHQEDSGPVNLPAGIDNGMGFGTAVGLGFDSLIAVGAPGTASPSGVRPEVGLTEVRRQAGGDWGLHSYWGELRPAANTPTHNNARFGSSLDFDVAGRTLAVGAPGLRIPGQPPPPRGQVWLYVEDRLFDNGFQCATGLPGC